MSCQARGVGAKRVSFSKPLVQEERADTPGAPRGPLCEVKGLNHRAVVAAKDGRCWHAVLACVPEAVQKAMTALETANMAGYERNGAPFTDYFKRRDLTTHYMHAADGELKAFIVIGTEGRGAGHKVFIYELHVAERWRCRGLATELLRLAEGTRPLHGHAPTLELNVHSANQVALRFYEKRHFRRADPDENDGGSVLVMRRVQRDGSRD